MENSKGAAFLSGSAAIRMNAVDARPGDLVEYGSSKAELFLVIRQALTSSLIAGVPVVQIEWTHYSGESGPRTYKVQIGPNTVLTLLSRP